MKDLGFKPKLPVPASDFLEEENRRKWMEEKHMKVFSLSHVRQPYLLIDVFTRNPFDFKEVYMNRRKIKAGRVTIPLVPLETLISMKENSDRPQDKADAAHLRKIAEEWNGEE